MVKNFKQEFFILEAEAVKNDLFVDYDALPPANGMFAVRCVVSNKDGRRICRFAADREIETAFEHAGYMALSAFFNKKVNESLYRVGSNNQANAVNQTRTDVANARSNSNVGQPQRQTVNNAVATQRQTSANNTAQSQRPQQNASAPTNKTPQNTSAPVTKPQQVPANQPNQNVNVHPVNGQQQTGQLGFNQVLPSGSNANPSGKQPAVANQATANQPRQNVAAANVQPTAARAQQTAASQNHNVAVQQNAPANPASQATAEIGKKPEENAVKAAPPEDISIPFGSWAHRADNHISDLLKEEAGRKALYAIYSKENLSPNLAPYKQNVVNFMNYYKIPITDAGFQKTGTTE